MGRRVARSHAALGADDRRPAAALPGDAAMIDLPDLTPEELAVRRALSDPRRLREMARETRGRWEWRQAAEKLRRFWKPRLALAPLPPDRRTRA